MQENIYTPPLMMYRKMSVLIIAEKYSVAERISYILSDGKAKRERKKNVPYFHFVKDGKDYFVIGLVGHVVELDYPENYRSWNLDDLEELITVNPIKVEKYKNLISVLKDLAKDAEMVIIATDYDREGELIGKETLEILNFKGKVKRAKFSALTKEEIIESFKNLTDLNENLAGAAESRQNIDLVWGAVLTRFFSLISDQKWKDFLSVGRVQSPTLALIVDREKEIMNFKPEKYWEIEAKLISENIEFNASYEGNPFKEKPEKIYEKLKNEKKAFLLEKKDHKYNIRPPAPFNTTEFLRESTKLGISVGKAMKIAEDLYSKGYISYPRTDNTVYPPSLNLKYLLEKFKNSMYGEYVENILKQEKIRPSRGKVESTDHPPIYPVKPIKENELKGEYFKIYDLVARRFLATLSPDAEVKSSEAKIKIDNETFIAKGMKIEKEGWMEVYPFLRIKEKILPEKMEKIDVKSIDLLEKETQPPERYTQASLIKAMENLNLGTKSTRHEIIEKLYERRYIEGSPIKPTNLGMAIVEAMERNNVEAVKPDMTAKLEIDMNEIEQGKVEKEKVMRESREMLKNILKELYENRIKIREILKGATQKDREFGTCPKCGSPLLIFKNKDSRYVQCSRYPDCDFKFYLPKTGKVEILDEKCPVCGLPLIKIVRKGQTPEKRCIDPKCKYNEKKDKIGICPEDGGFLVIRQSSNGKRFIGCSNYPKCKVTFSLPQKGEIIPTDEKCPVCGLPLIIVKNGKKTRKMCIDPKCKYNKGDGK